MIVEPETTQKYYVYQLKLADSMQYDMYLLRPCIHISLFKNEKDAKAYHDYSKSESKIFQKQQIYKNLVKIGYRAIMR
ncbi:MAG: hypothetical protein J6S57_00815 [Alphaproteobacteria bacterium]|nr:hypothetical protein [Alphaproteobacteria bacterium]